MGIEGEEDEFIETAVFFECGDGIFGERLPIAHGGDGDRIDVRLQGGDEFGALALREDANRRAAADHGVALGDRNATFLGDVSGERAANEIDGTERNDVGIEKEIAEEGFDGIEGIRPTQLKENDADALPGRTILLCSGEEDFRQLNIGGA